MPPDFTTFWNQAKQQGFKPKVASVGKAILFPGRGRGARQDRQQPVVGSLVDAEPSVQVVAHRPIGQGDRQPPTRNRPASNGPSRSASSMRCSRSRSTSSSARGDAGDTKAMVKAIAATNLDTIVGPIAWDGKNLPPFAAKNVAKTPLVGGQWRLARRQQVRHRHHRQPDRAGDSGRRQDGADRVSAP